MKVKILHAELQEMMSLLIPAADKDTASPVAGVFLKAVKVDGVGYLYGFATNTTAYMFYRTPADVSLEGEVLLTKPAIMVSALAGHDPSTTVDMSLNASATQLTVKAGKGRFVLATNSNVKVFHSQIERIPTTEPSHTMKGADLAEFCSRSAFCIGEEFERFQTNGLMITDSDEGYHAYATNGKVVAVKISVEGEKKSALGKLLIPDDAIEPLSRIAAKRRDDDVKIILGEQTPTGIPTSLHFKIGAAMYGTRLLLGNFPDLGAMFEVNTPTSTVELERAQLRTILTRALSFYGEKKALEMTFSKDEIGVVVPGDNGRFTDSMAYTLTEGDSPEGMTVVLNSQFLGAIISKCTGEKVSMGVTSEYQAVRFEDSNDNVVANYLLMPIKRSAVRMANQQEEEVTV